MPDLTPQMERELAELEAALAPIIRDERPEPREAWAARMDRRMQAEFKAAPAPRPSRGRRWSQLLLSGPAFGTVAAAALIAVLVVPYRGPGTDDMGSAGSGGGASESASAPGAGESAGDLAADGGGVGTPAPAGDAASGAAGQARMAEPL